MAFYKQDIVDINLNTGNIHRSFLNHAIGYKNDDADRFGIRTFRDGEPVDLTGVSCQAVFMAPDGSNIALTSYGTVSGNVAYVTLPPACYNYEGQFCLSIQLVGGGVTGTMRIVDGVVVNTGASGTVAPTSSVPTYQEIIAQYDAMVAATAAANGAIAATYSGSATYKVGDYCIHDGGLYRCTTAITTAEAWNAAHWTATKIGPDVSDLKGAFDEDITALEAYSRKWNTIPVTFEQGGYATSGGGTGKTKVDSTTRIRSVDYIPVYMFNTITPKLPAGMKVNTFLFDKDKTYISQTTYKSTETAVTVSGAYYIRVVYGYTNDGNISPSDGSDIKIVGTEQRFVSRGFINSLGYTALTNCRDSGWYGCSSSYLSSITDLPTGYPSSTPFHLMVFKPSAGNSTYIIQELHSNTGKVWQRTINTSGTVSVAWTLLTKDPKDISNYALGNLDSLGITALSNCKDYGWYGIKGTYISSITDLPTGYSGAGILFVYPSAFNQTAGFILQILENIDNEVWERTIYTSGTVYKNWKKTSNNYGAKLDLTGKTIAIIGDSISTNGNTGDYPNVPEMIIQSEDVGVELSAYLTYYDVQGGLSIGGHTFTSDEIGTEVTFTPVEGDIGKKIGLPYTFYDTTIKCWWEVMMDAFNFTPIPVCWSGSSITSHEGNTSEYKTSYAWHDAQIRKCGIRTAGSMTRTAPDIIIIYRGTNDMTHPSANPFVANVFLTEDYFDNYNWQYPDNDSVTGGYGYKEGLCLTIKKLRNAYPKAKIFLCTMNVFKRVNYSHFPTNNGTNSLPQFNDAIREVADFMGCGVIEFDKDGITFENVGDYTTDGTHPKDNGHRIMGLKAIADMDAKYSSM